MEYFNTDNTCGFHISRDNYWIQTEIDKNKTIIILKINNNTLSINKEYINNKITPNFSVEMFYYVLCNLVKYNNYKLINSSDDNYIFEGYYVEHYEQSDMVHINLII